MTMPMTMTMTMTMTIILLLFEQYKLLYIMIIIIIIYNIIVYIYNDEREIKIKRDKIRKYNNCRASTINNPYMNKDIMDKRDIKICSETNEEQIQDNLIYNLYQDETDINGLKKLRIFVTVPERDYTIYQEFMNSDRGECKDKGKGCEIFRELRFNK